MGCQDREQVREERKKENKRKQTNKHTYNGVQGLSGDAKGLGEA